MHYINGAIKSQHYGNLPEIAFVYRTTSCERQQDREISSTAKITKNFLRIINIDEPTSIKP